jgi:hypothetical protein
MWSPFRMRRITWPTALVALFVAFSAEAADRSLEYRVKAAFLYKFASFVEWPAGTFANDTAPFNLCILGSDPFGGRIEEAVAGQSVGGHRVVLRKIDVAEPGSRCHAMFVSASGAQSAADALKAVSGTPTLTVTDSALGSTAGIVHFVIVDDRVSFDIDNVAAARNRLVISSKLLAVARRLNTSRPGTSR